jgi:hypothetical protein
MVIDDTGSLFWGSYLLSMGIEMHHKVSQKKVDLDPWGSCLSNFG